MVLNSRSWNIGPDFWYTYKAGNTLEYEWSRTVLYRIAPVRQCGQCKRSEACSMRLNLMVVGLSKWALFSACSVWAGFATFIALVVCRCILDQLRTCLIRTHLQQRQVEVAPHFTTPHWHDTVWCYFILTQMYSQFKMVGEKVYIKVISIFYQNFFKVSLKLSQFSCKFFEVSAQFFSICHF